MIIPQNTALVLEGGGFRGMYTSGVLDAFLKHKVYFPYVIGVSAGAAYGISYASRQFERNRVVNLKYTADPRYMSWGNLFRKGNLFDWDFVYGEIPNHLVPFDYKALKQNDCRFMVGVTHVESGKPRYFDARQWSSDDLLSIVTASSSLPFVSHMARFNNELYMDGGLADSIPLEKALKDGCERAIVVLTRNSDYRKTPVKHKWLIKGWYRKYPELVTSILSRAERYNATLDLLEQLEKEGKVFILRPQGRMNVSRIENNPDKLDQLYLMGLHETGEQLNHLERWLADS